MLKKISDICYMHKINETIFLLKRHCWGSYNHGIVWDLIVIIGSGDGHKIATFATKDDGTHEMCKDCEQKKIWNIDDMLQEAEKIIENF